jgi:hypothetical protein
MLASVNRPKTSFSSGATRSDRSVVVVMVALAICIAPWMGAMGCGGAESAVLAPPPSASARLPVLLPAGNAPQFRFRSLDGREISSDVVLGRNTVLAFLATFDWASQAQARFVSGVERNHRPRTNCYALALERPENRMLVESFIETLSLRYPVAHVPADELAKTELRGVVSVPSVLVLDAGGNIVWKSHGLVTEETLSQVLHEVERRGGTKP